MIPSMIPRNGCRPEVTGEYLAKIDRAKRRHYRALLRWKEASAQGGKRAIVYFWIRGWSRSLRRNAAMVLMR